MRFDPSIRGRIAAGVAVALAVAAFGPLMADVGEQSGNHPEPAPGTRWAATDERAAVVGHFGVFSGEGDQWRNDTASIWIWSRESKLAGEDRADGRTEGRILLTTKHESASGEQTRTWRGTVESKATFTVTPGLTGLLAAALTDDDGEQCAIRGTWAGAYGRVKYVSPTTTEHLSDAPHLTLEGTCLTTMNPMTASNGRIWHRLEHRTSEDRPAARTPREDEIITIAGVREDGYDGDGGPARWAHLAAPSDMAIAPDGTIYISERSRIRRIDAGGTISTMLEQDCRWTEDGPDPSSTLCDVSGVAADAAGNLLISDGQMNMVRRFAPDGTPLSPPVRAGRLSGPAGLTVAPDGSIYVAEPAAQRVTRIASGGDVETVAGTGDCDVSPPATMNVNTAGLCQPSDVAVTSDGTVYVTEPGAGRIRRIAGGRATIMFDGPGPGSLPGYVSAFWTSIAVDGDDTLFASSAGGRIYRIDAPYRAALIAGSDVFSPFDEMPAVLAQLEAPMGLAFDPNGYLGIVEQSASTVRLADVDAAPRGAVTTASPPQQRAALRSSECCAEERTHAPVPLRGAVASRVRAIAAVEAGSESGAPAAVPARGIAAAAIAMIVGVMIAGTAVIGRASRGAF